MFTDPRGGDLIELCVMTPMASRELVPVHWALGEFQLMSGLIRDWQHELLPIGTLGLMLRYYDDAILDRALCLINGRAGLVHLDNVMVVARFFEACRVR